MGRFAQSPGIAIGMFFLVLLAPQGARGQESTPSSSYARRGMVIGGISGGVLGGLGLAVLANGLCEYDCDNAFQEGLLIGLLGGGVFGGISGLVIGAAIPRGGDPGSGVSGGKGGAVEPWVLGLGIGPRYAGPSNIEGTDLWVGVMALRPTTSRIRWGLELAYLGRASETETFYTSGREGEDVLFTNQWRRTVWDFSLVAKRSFGEQPRSGGFLLANVGIYPILESVNSVRNQGDPDPSIPIEISERSWGAFPGLGLGGGGRWAVGDRLDLGFESRLHLLLGAGDESVLPMLSLGVNLLRRGG